MDTNRTVDAKLTGGRGTKVSQARKILQRLRISLQIGILSLFFSGCKSTESAIGEKAPQSGTTASDTRDFESVMKLTNGQLLRPRPREAVAAKKSKVPSAKASNAATNTPPQIAAVQATAAQATVRPEPNHSPESQPTNLTAQIPVAIPVTQVSQEADIKAFARENNSDNVERVAVPAPKEAPFRLNWSLLLGAGLIVLSVGVCVFCAPVRKGLGNFRLNVTDLIEDKLQRLRATTVAEASKKRRAATARSAVKG